MRHRHNDTCDGRTGSTLLQFIHYSLSLPYDTTSTSTFIILEPNIQHHSNKKDSINYNPRSSLFHCGCICKLWMIPSVGMHSHTINDGYNDEDRTFLIRQSTQLVTSTHSPAGKYDKRPPVWQFIVGIQQENDLLDAQSNDGWTI